MGLGISIFLIALGAILAFAINVQPEGFNVNTTGWILMAVGAVGALLALVLGAGRSDAPPRDEA